LGEAKAPVLDRKPIGVLHNKASGRSFGTLIDRKEAETSLQQFSKIRLQPQVWAARGSFTATKNRYIMIRRIVSNLVTTVY